MKKNKKECIDERMVQRMTNRDRLIEALKSETEEQREYVYKHISCPHSYDDLNEGFCELDPEGFEKDTRGTCIECKVDWLMQEEAKKKAPITDEQKAFLEGISHAETVLDEYFEMLLNTWSGCTDEYQRSAKIIQKGVAKWLTTASFERYTDFVKGNEVE